MHDRELRGCTGHAWWPKRTEALHELEFGLVVPVKLEKCMQLHWVLCVGGTPPILGLKGDLERQQRPEFSQQALIRVQ